MISFDTIMLISLAAGFFGGLAFLAVDRPARRHRAPGLPRMRRSGTMPRRRAERDYTLTA